MLVDKLKAVIKPDHLVNYVDPEENIVLVVAHGGFVSWPELQILGHKSLGLMAIKKVSAQFLKLHELQAFSDNDAENLEIHYVSGSQLRHHPHCELNPISAIWSQ